MTLIARVAQFAPKPGEEDHVLLALQSHRDYLAAFGGCRRAYLGTPIHGRQILVYSEWESETDVERLEAALRGDLRVSSDLFGLLGRLSTPMTIGLFAVLP